MNASPQSPASAAAVIVAAGRSARFGTTPEGARKPLVTIEGQSLLELACAAFAASAHVREIVLVVHADDRERIERLAAGREAFAKVSALVPGGAERSDSVQNGVGAIRSEAALVAVHDAARPLVRTALVDAVFECAAATGAALAAVPLRDTVKESSDGRCVEHTLERSRLWAAQTPQSFELARFRDVLARAAAEGVRPTDDAALWERYVGPVAIVPGDPTNLKVTTPEDLLIARALFAQRHAAETAG